MSFHRQRAAWRREKMKAKGIKALTAMLLLAWHGIAGASWLSCEYPSGYIQRVGQAPGNEHLSECWYYTDAPTSCGPLPYETVAINIGSRSYVKKVSCWDMCGTEICSTF